MSGLNKVTKVVKEDRVTKIIQLLVAGMDGIEIVRYIQDKTDWNVCESHIYNYIKDAKKYIRELTNEDRLHQIGLAIRRMLFIYTKCTTQPSHWNPSAAISAQQEINKLLGLYSPVRVDMAVTDLTKRDKEDLNSIDDLEFINYEEVKE